eukprot:TRINITY_DN1954_c0_g1_i1.p2 TRINITY_DN1954_c0_g1~~TRINITY_DN1954_c0_g1_i1.p2  ORF type:complete len:112 (+),score=16.95 TRINITY_DN1954_c0_g1_i1:57-392(+)
MESDFPEPPKDLIIQLATNVCNHLSDPENQADVELIKEKLTLAGPDSAPVFEVIIARRVEEKPESSLAPWNSPEGAVFFRDSALRMAKADPELGATLQPLIAQMQSICGVH